MVLQDITLHLPDSILRRARQAAQALQRPVEEVLATALSAALPDLKTRRLTCDRTWPA